jgi:hypothetical protein
VLAFEMVFTDGMGGIVFIDINLTVLITEPISHHFFNKPVPERVPWTQSTNIEVCHLKLPPFPKTLPLLSIFPELYLISAAII